MRRIVPAACGVLLAAAAVAQAPAALPLQNLGLEHLDIIVPDTEASARFPFEDNNRIVVELRVAG